MIRALFRFHQHIVNINLHGTAEQRSEHFRHQPLISGSCILQFEGRHIIAIQPVRHDERCLFYIRGVHRDLVISIESVQKGKHVVPCRCIHNLIYTGQGEAIFGTGVVEVCVVHTYSPFVPFFWNHHYIGQPLGVFHCPNESIL